MNKQNNTFIGFTQCLEQIITFFKIKGSTEKWARYFSTVNASSSERSLIKQAADIFLLEFTEVDLHVTQPNTQAYLIKKGHWIFTVKLDNTDKEITKIYSVKKKIIDKEKPLNSLFDLLLIDGNRTVFLLLFVSFFINVFALTIPLYFNAMYGRIIPASAEASLWTLSAIALICFLCEFFLKKIKSQYSYQLMAEFKNTIQPALFNDVLDSPNHRDNHWGIDKTRILRDIRELNVLMWGLISTNVLDIFFIFLFLLTIFVMAGSLVVIPIVIFSLQLRVGHAYSKKEAQQSGVNPQFIGGISLENHYMNGMNENLSSTFFTQEEENYEHQKKGFLQKQNMHHILYFLTSIQNIFITVVAFFLIQKQDISIAALFAAIILSSRISQSVMGFISSLPLLHKIKNKIQLIKQFREKNTHHTSYQETSSLELTDDFSWDLNQIKLAYLPNHPLLNSLDLKIKKGEKVAIVGSMGAGKTALAKMLSGLLIPSEGDIALTLNGGNKLPVSQVTPYVHYLSQQPFLYGESIIGHLCSEQNHNEADCLSVLQYPIYAWLPPLLKNGLYTKFNQLPTELSSTQKQMLLMARFNLTSRDVWILDEPIELMDNVAQHHFYQIAKEKITASTTLLLCTQNMALFDLIERVIVLSEGKVAYDGNKAQFKQKFVK
ncbi:MAG: ATP-binding cassette domain-containing protein [Providencia heimbachae]|nr:ATP-binding cassette domain-containing protein [Providencia heimbachae]